MVPQGVVLSTFVVVFSYCSFPQTTASPIQKQYRSPGGSRVVVVPVASYESRVDFYTARGAKLCSADLSSGDGSHGYDVARAAWTPDGRYFVFSMKNSGGHSVMETPTLFFSGETHQLCSLDEYVDGNGIEFPDFRLIAPNTVEVTTNLKRGVRVSLDSLLRGSTKPKASACFSCSGGGVHKLGDPTRYDH
jgi:hypothetical protein